MGGEGGGRKSLPFSTAPRRAINPQLNREMRKGRTDGGGRKAGPMKGNEKKSLEKPAAIQLSPKLKKVLLGDKRLSFQAGSAH